MKVYAMDEVEDVMRYVDVVGLWNKYLVRIRVFIFSNLITIFVFLVFV